MSDVLQTPQALLPSVQLTKTHQSHVRHCINTCPSLSPDALALGLPLPTPTTFCHIYSFPFLVPTSLLHAPCFLTLTPSLSILSLHQVSILSLAFHILYSFPSLLFFVKSFLYFSILPPLQYSPFLYFILYFRHHSILKGHQFISCRLTSNYHLHYYHYWNNADHN